MPRESACSWPWSWSSLFFVARTTYLFLLVTFFILSVLTVNTCTTFPTFSPSSTNDDIRVTSFTSLGTPESTHLNQRISSNPNTASGWSSVFIPSEFHFINRRIQTNNNNFASQHPHSHQSHQQNQLFNSAAAFESNFNLLQSEQKNQVEESIEDTFLNAIDDISRGLRCHPAYTSRGN